MVAKHQMVAVERCYRLIADPIIDASKVDTMGVVTMLLGIVAAHVSVKDEELVRDLTCAVNRALDRLQAGDLE